MTYCTLFSLLTFLAFSFGVYFAYTTAREENKRFDVTEFLKILGLFVLCGLVFGIFVDIFFLVARALLWLLMHISNFLKTQLLARKTGAILSLLAINAMGGFLFWEIWWEGKEHKETDFSIADTPPPPVPEDQENGDVEDQENGDVEAPSQVEEVESPSETAEAPDAMPEGDQEKEGQTDSGAETTEEGQPK